MKKTEIVGFKRANLGRSASQELRAQGNVPCVLYGGEEQISFHAPAYLFRPLINTPDAYEVLLNIEGTEYTAILQETQFHPVNDQLIHADFLLINPDKVIKIEVPIKLQGLSIGQQKGGKLVQMLRKLRIQGPAKSIPEFISLNIEELDLGKSVKVGAIQLEGVKILVPAANPVATITVPRALRGQ